MIHIEDMTPKRQAMLDVIWECKSAAEFVKWRNSLNKQDQNEAMCLLELLRLASLDTEVEKSDDYTMAQKLHAEVMIKER